MIDSECLYVDTRYSTFLQPCIEPIESIFETSSSLPFPLKQILFEAEAEKIDISIRCFFFLHDLMADNPAIDPLDHRNYMRLALSLAEKSTPRASNFRVGAVLVDEDVNQILATGYTLELPGNTHAEQCSLEKYHQRTMASNEDIQKGSAQQAVLYTTMEPCNYRASGNVPCSERILNAKTNIKLDIKTVYVGVTEPDTFVKENKGETKLKEAGITIVHIPGLESQILEVATTGHKSSNI